MSFRWLWAPVAAVLLTNVSRAEAHGPPPAATAVLAASDQQASLVRLSPGGLALRVPNGFRFLCPESWGGNVLAPAASLPLGATLVASSTLFVVDHDGRISPHPVQAGTASALAPGSDAAFGLFENAGQHELRRITANTNELVRATEQPFAALAVGHDVVSLLRWLGDSLSLQRVSFSGELLQTVSWSVANGVAYARLTVAAERLYVSTWGNGSPWVTLGIVTEHGYEPLREASVDIAGPIALDTGDVVAVDGQLQTVDSSVLVDTQGRRVTCLGEVDGLPYLCTGGDLYRVDARGIGASIFALSSLLDPDYQGLSDAARSNCTARWLDLRVDAVAAQSATDVDGGRGATEAAHMPSEGCSTAPAAPGAPGWVALTVALALRRRVAKRAR